MSRAGDGEERREERGERRERVKEQKEGEKRRSKKELHHPFCADVSVRNEGKPCAGEATFF